ncbi:MAG: energy-coupled thiamine transporter ThiT [Clostridia bacterium]|nr:energy-coupled thiamine transporter ThiT [Clostridia bacterium]
MNSTKRSTVLFLTESAIMVALATVLSVLKLIDMPYGGSVTICSMLPIAFVAYRYGFPKGLIVSLVYALVQMILGSDNFSYATSATAVVLIIVLDYLIAFCGYSFAGLLSKSKMSQTTALGISVVISGLFRYACHTISGYAVWRDLSAPAKDAWIYTIAYNAAYMIPEIIATFAAAIGLSKLINLKGNRVSAVKSTSKGNFSLPRAIALVIMVVSSMFAIAMIFSKLQAEDGTFSVTGISNVNFVGLGIAVGFFFVGAVLLFVVFGKNKAKKN